LIRERGEYSVQRAPEIVLLKDLIGHVARLHRDDGNVSSSPVESNYQITHPAVERCALGATVVVRLTERGKRGRYGVRAKVAEFCRERLSDRWADPTADALIRGRGLANLSECLADTVGDSVEGVNDRPVEVE
jgi:hypothetical protein